MVIRYIGLRKYNDINNPININLGGPYLYAIDKHDKMGFYVKVDNRVDDYIYNLYKHVEIVNVGKEFSKKTYRGASEVSAIVGQNSAGKTSTLKMISNILRESSESGLGKYDFFMIQEDISKKEIYVTSNFNDNSRNAPAYIHLLEESLRENGYKGKVRHISEEVTLDNKQQIYFSGVFDKASPLSSSNNLVDISTNTVLDEFVRRTSHGIDNGKEGASIEDFRFEEVFNRIELVRKHPELESILQFEFPEKVKLRFTERRENKEKIRLEFTKNYKEGTDPAKADRFDFLQQQIDKEIDEYESKAEDNKELYKDVRKRELAIQLIDEYIYSCLQNTGFSMADVLDRLIKIIHKRGKKPAEFVQCIDHMDLQIITKYKDKDDNQEKNQKASDNKEKLRKDDYLNISSNIKDVRESLYKYKERIENFTEDDIWIYEFFNELEDTLREGKENYDYPYEEAVSRIMEPYWNGEEPVDYLSVNGIQVELEQCIDDYDMFLRDYLIAHAKKESDSDYFQAGGEDDGLSEQKLLHVEDIDKYEIVDAKAKKIIKVYECFEKLTKMDGYTARKNSSSISLFKKGTLEVSKSGKQFMELYDMCFPKDEQEFPDGFSIFQATVDQFDVCSGYSGYFDMLSRLSKISEDVCNSGKKEIVIMLDEGELYLHPQAQKDFVLHFLMAVQCFFPNKDVQIIMSTNSPFILSDVQSSNILCLDKLDFNGLTVCARDVLGKTFGTNITTLLINDFFMHEGVVGSFARNKINDIIGRLNEPQYKDDQQKDYKLINIIGDDLVRGKLKLMYNEKTAQSKKEFYQKRIELYKEKIKELETMMEEQNDTT